MKTLSKTEYKNETEPYELKDKLIEIGLSDVYFAKAAIYIAKSVQHLIVEEHKKICLDALEIAEKYLQGEVTPEECHEAVQKVFFFVYGVGAGRVTYYACHAAYEAAYDAINAAYAAQDALFSNFSISGACNILKQAIPWNLVCATQIAKCSGKENNENFIQNIIKDENLINYATILLEDENLREEFEFLMKDYVNK